MNNDIYDVLMEKSVSRLCHFTKLENLVHILNSSDGILATNFIDENKNVIDPNRRDMQLDYICCSIEYPNSWFLEDAKERNESIFNDWVVLYIKPDIVRERCVKVSECNAAKSNGYYIKKGDYKSTAHLFDYKVPSFNHPRTEKMLKCCPTNAQAEIMIYCSIPKEYIFGIAVMNTDMAERVYGILSLLRIENIDIYISPDVIGKRWRRLIQEGNRPLEERYFVKEG